MAFKDWILPVAIILAIFIFGYGLGRLQGDRDLVKYRLEVLQKRAEMEAEWLEKFAEAGAELARLRQSESSARADTDRMRKQLADMRTRAETAESQSAVRCGELAVRCQELLDRASTMVGYCDKVMR